ncbi:MAG TPA: efflux RND transporter periplasmic adaptor subunit [Candidatus Aminicenantes bacterium]|nr:efflux RND transporter periplasmic adaptor subunit [Candidatus Aminicenantes bacterium]
MGLRGSEPMRRCGPGWGGGVPWVLGAILLVTACTGTRQFRIEKVVRGPFNVVVQASGQLRSTASLYVGCPSVERMWEFTIVFMAPEGKPVKAGDLILSFDSRELNERLQVKMTELETEKKELQRLRLAELESKEDMILGREGEKVQKEKARQKADVPEEFIAANELKKRRMDLELAELKERLAEVRIQNQTSGMNARFHVQEAKIRVLQEQVDRLQMDIGKLEVKAPKDGMVVYTPDWDGKKKNVGDSCWIGESILELPDLGRMQMNAVILEPQAGKIKVGQEAEIRLDANPDRVFRGRVARLGRIFRLKSDTQPVVVFDAELDLSESDPALMRPGMAATARIFMATRKDVLMLPEAALVYHEKGLYVRRRGLLKERLVPVTIGSRSADMVEITGGLKEHDEALIRVETEDEKP